MGANSAVSVRLPARTLKTRDGIFEIDLNLNGAALRWRVRPSETLLDALRRNGWRGAKRGCDTGECGSCTVIIDGRPMLSCLLPAVAAHGRDITTIEGLGGTSNPHPIQQAFAETGAVQCGFCIPGMILSAKSLLDENTDPSPRQIRHALDGNLCRCTGYVKQIEAVSLAAQRIRRGSPAGSRKRRAAASSGRT